VSFLPYAHVPWIKPSQRRYTEADLPDAALRQQLFRLGRERLAAAGYIEIGLDQYALPRDPLALALAAGRLQRSFMGFSATRTDALIGLGVSAIGDSRAAYAQNEKSLQQYETRLAAGELPLQRGHVLGADDLRIRSLLWNLLTTSRTTIDAGDLAMPWWPGVEQSLRALASDGLVHVEPSQITVIGPGRALLRQIGVAFDQYLRQTP
jgi:oxygen-independent coproporphyrinogen-3 oxidase